MPKIAVSYNKDVGGVSAISLMKSASEAGADTIGLDYYSLLPALSESEFEEKYNTLNGRKQLLAYAKQQAFRKLHNCDCLVIPGNNAMIDPEFYGQQRSPDAEYNFRRTVSELALVHAAKQMGIPILGVCGGHQVIAVYEGAKLNGLDYTQFNEHAFDDYHTIRFSRNSILARILQRKNEPGFCSHNMYVTKAPKNMSVAGQTGRGNHSKIIEAMESKHGAPVITTQFHPEASVKGLHFKEPIPIKPFIYKLNPNNADKMAKVFDFFKGAADTKSKQRTLMSEICSLASMASNGILKPSEVKDRVSKPLELTLAPSYNAENNLVFRATPRKHRGLFMKILLYIPIRIKYSIGLIIRKIFAYIVKKPELLKLKKTSNMHVTNDSKTYTDADANTHSQEKPSLLPSQTLQPFFPMRDVFTHTPGISELNSCPDENQSTVVHKP